eukprot:3917260-Amphidinium_carterae.1
MVVVKGKLVVKVAVKGKLVVKAPELHFALEDHQASKDPGFRVELCCRLLAEWSQVSNATTV